MVPMKKVAIIVRFIGAIIIDNNWSANALPLENAVGGPREELLRDILDICGILERHLEVTCSSVSDKIS